MTKLVPRDQIESLVEAHRQPTFHVGKADSSKGSFFILHSNECLDSLTDLRYCEFSRALDNGIKGWEGYENKPHILAIKDNMIVPLIKLLVEEE